MKKEKFYENLVVMGACKPALRWVAMLNNTPSKTWRACKEGDWMAWLMNELLDRLDKQNTRANIRLARKIAKKSGMSKRLGYKPYDFEDLQYLILDDQEESNKKTQLKNAATFKKYVPWSMVEKLMKKAKDKGRLDANWWLNL